MKRHHEANHEKPGVTDARSTYVRDLVLCPHCQTQQTVHLLPSATNRTASELLLEVVSCARCTRRFAVRVADKIIDGPFVIEPECFRILEDA